MFLEECCMPLLPYTFPLFQSSILGCCHFSSQPHIFLHKILHQGAKWSDGSGLWSFGLFGHSDVNLTTGMYVLIWSSFQVFNNVVILDFGSCVVFDTFYLHFWSRKLLAFDGLHCRSCPFDHNFANFVWLPGLERIQFAVTFWQHFPRDFQHLLSQPNQPICEQEI